MASWKKVLVSGSSIAVNQITASGIPTVDNEANLLALSADGGITQITQGSIAGTNPTFTIEAINGASTTTDSFTTTGSLIFSHSLDHGFGFTVTDSDTTSSVSLQTPQDLQTTANVTFDSLTLTGTSGDLFVNQGIHLGNGASDFTDAIITSSGDLLEIRDNSSVGVVIDSNNSSAPGEFSVKAHIQKDTVLLASSSGKVGIGNNVLLDENSILTVSGTIHTAGITASALPVSTDSITVIVDGGSGRLEKRDISSAISGAIDAATASFSASIIGTANEIGVTTDGSGNVVIGLVDDVTIPNNLTVTNDTSLGNNLDLTGGNITVHGNISASGDITASNIRVDNDIALGGNIFSFSGFSFIEGVSANFTGSNLFGSGSTPSANDIAGGGTAHQFTGSVAITGSALTLDEANLTLDNGSITATNGSITVTNGAVTATNGTGSFGYLTAYEISSSGHLYAELPNDTGTFINDGVVVYDTATGQLLYTASSAVGVTDFPDLNSIPNLLVSGAIALVESAQGEYDITVGGVTVSDGISAGLLTSDSPTFAGLTTTGNTALGNGSGDTVTIAGNVTASGVISASGNLFASLSSNSNALNTVVYDTSTGQFFHTGSYGGGGVDSINSSLVDYSGTNIVSGALFNSNAQGVITASINDISSSFDVGLTTADSPTFTGLTITGDATFGDSTSDTVTIVGDLIVEGNTTTISTSNLSIEDKFILLASGSGQDTTAGIVIERSSNGVGTGLFWDSTKGVWSIDFATADASAGNNSATVDARIATIQHATSVPSNPGYGDTTGDYAQAKGQLFIDTNDDYGVYIWV